MIAVDRAADAARCRAEIAVLEAQLRAGTGDTHGLLLGLADWSAELRLLEDAAR